MDIKFRVFYMKFKSSENEIKNAIEILDSLINSKPAAVFDAIKGYKSSKSFDMFTSYRLNKELNRINTFKKGL